MKDIISHFLKIVDFSNPEKMKKCSKFGGPNPKFMRDTNVYICKKTIEKCRKGIGIPIGIVELEIPYYSTIYIIYKYYKRKGKKEGIYIMELRKEGYVPFCGIMASNN